VPTNRVLYTIGDIKNVLAKLEGVTPDSVEVFEPNTLARVDFSQDFDSYPKNMSDDHYLFQVDK
jgi:pantothenate synthetase